MSVLLYSNSYSILTITLAGLFLLEALKVQVFIGLEIIN